MAQRPAFGALKKAKPGLTVVDKEPAPAPAPNAEPRPVIGKSDRIQTSVRLEPAMWAALNDLATRKRVEVSSFQSSKVPRNLDAKKAQP